MAKEKRNLLLGNGESLTSPVSAPGKDQPNKLPVYSLVEAKQRLKQDALTASSSVESLSSIACPNDEAVISLILHPEFLAKSYFPEHLLTITRLRPVGSKDAKVTPHKWSKKSSKEDSPTSELFVAGKRTDISSLAGRIDALTAGTQAANDAVKVERILFRDELKKIQPIHSDKLSLLFEAVLHDSGELPFGQLVRHQFVRFLGSLGIECNIEHRVDASGLSFVAVRAPSDMAQGIANFSFLRSIREMPRLRQDDPGEFYDVQNDPFDIQLADVRPRNRDLRTKIYDGGVPKIDAFRFCVEQNEPADIGPEVPEYLAHGLAVTSAFLFGPLQEGVRPPDPYGIVEHVRVLDENTYLDSQSELYSVLNRICEDIKSDAPNFVNICIGPDIPADDDDVHPWTYKLDGLLSDGKTVTAAAVGNSGRLDPTLGQNRIQPPSDAWNMLSVGAADSEDGTWRRAEYSSVGWSDRNPDCVTFGGSDNSPFYVCQLIGNKLVAVPQQGTSLATPFTLRTATGIRFELGQDVNELAIMAMLVHSSELRDLGQNEVGWGRICTNVQDLVTCPETSATVLYQGVIEAKQTIRAAIPTLPISEMKGKATISATVCIATAVDGEHPENYSRSGLDIVFRRDKMNVEPGKTVPKSDSFFPSTFGMTEAEIRKGTMRWEAVRHASKIVYANTLHEPVLDIHYIPRHHGADARSAPAIPYAVLFTIDVPKVPNFQQRISARYRSLRPLRPRFRQQIRRK